MKKGFLTTILLLFAFVTLSAQYVDRTFFKAGVHAALPVGDAADIASFGLGLDLYQHWGITKTIDLGVATGFTNAFVKDEITSGDIVIETEFDNVQFLPLAALVRFYPALKFNIGADIGYALGINEGNEGGFYYRPTLNFEVGGNTGLYFSYTGINNDGGTWATVTGGLLILF